MVKIWFTSGYQPLKGEFVVSCKEWYEKFWEKEGIRYVRIIPSRKLSRRTKAKLVAFRLLSKNPWVSFGPCSCGDIYNCPINWSLYSEGHVKSCGFGRCWIR